MIVNTVYGDIIKMGKDGYFDGIIQGCNCQNKMKLGLAARIARSFPEVNELDQMTTRGDISKLGTYQYIEYDMYPRPLTVINAYTQKYYGRYGKYVSEQAVATIFHNLNEEFGNDSFTLGIPLIGCGYGGGDWNIIQQIINDMTPNLDLILVLKE